jgi:hypothetical protein
MFKKEATSHIPAQTSALAMPQRSKLIRSREEWKKKAVSRADELRDRRKAEKRLRGRIAELDRQVEELKQAAEEKKSGTAGCE